MEVLLALEHASWKTPPARASAGNWVPGFEPGGVQQPSSCWLMMMRDRSVPPFPHTDQVLAEYDSIR